MATLSTKPATMEDFLRAEAEAPEGTRLALIDGEIVEWGANATTRNARHSTTMAKMAHQLWNWAGTQPSLSPVVAGGEVRCLITHDPEQIVGLDVVVFFGADHQRESCEADYFEGPPTIAVEILSGSDTHGSVVDRIQVLIGAGVRQVWIVDPELRYLTVYRPDSNPVLYASSQTLVAEPELPGFQVPVNALFPTLPA